MPHKTPNWRWEGLQGGKSDFKIDDLHVTKHAKIRAAERGLTFEEMRSPTWARVVGKTLVTVVPKEQKPVTLPGKFGAPQRTPEERVEMGLSPHEPPRQLHLIMQTRPATITYSSATAVDAAPRQKACHANRNAAAEEFDERARAARRTAAAAAAAATTDGSAAAAAPAPLVIPATGVASITYTGAAGVCVVSIRGYEGHVIGRDGRNVKAWTAKYPVNITINRAAGTAQVANVSKPAEPAAPGSPRAAATTAAATPAATTAAATAPAGPRTDAAAVVARLIAERVLQIIAEHAAKAAGEVVGNKRSARAAARNATMQ